MSQWTHIKGVLRLSASVYSTAVNSKTGEQIPVLPLPDEQMEIENGICDTWWNEKTGEKESELTFRVYEYSLPRVKPTVHWAIEKFMPHGEVGFGGYSLHQDKYKGNMSSSDFDFPCEEKQFKKVIEERYKNCIYQYSVASWKDIKEHLHPRLRWVEHVTDFDLSIDDDIRYCSGSEMMLAMEKLLGTLEANDISVDSGYAEWEDEYDGEHLYAIRKDSWITRFMVLNKENNQIVAQKKIEEIFHPKGENEIKVEETDNWKEFIKNDDCRGE